MIETCIKI